MPPRVASISDYRELARRRLPRMLFEYVDGGSYDEVTLRANVQDLQAIRLRQRVMRDVSATSLATHWFGRDWSLPVALGPVGFAGAFARRGELQAARAAGAAGVPFTLSTVGICSVEEVAAALPGAFWFQLYVIRDRGFLSGLLERVAAARPAALVLTADLPVAGARYRDVRSGMHAPGAVGTLSRLWQAALRPRWSWDVALRGRPLAFANLEGAVRDAKHVDELLPWLFRNMDPSVTWQDLDWIRERWSGPLVVKGILDPEDAAAALAAGADAVVVSNHGGRQLDGVSSSIRALPAIVERVAGRIPVFVDGGIRSGIDVLRALALGANGCLLGRAWAYALAADGERGVRHALAVIREELRVAMALTGLTRVQDAGAHLLHREP
ncbi:MAG: L-lactate dehydrogenase [Pseudomonadota bacterium]